MGEYLRVIIAVPIVTGLLGMVLPEGKLRRQTRLIIALAALLAVLSPVLGLVKELQNGMSEDVIPKETATVPDAEDEVLGKELIVEETCRRICSLLESRVETEFGLAKVKIRLICDSSDYENVVIESAVMTVTDESSGVYRAKCLEAAKYVEETLGCKCTTDFDGQKGM